VPVTPPLTPTVAVTSHGTTVGVAGSF